MNKKYELTDETVIIGERVLHRIRALRNFGNVKKGDRGGFIEKELNLAHNETCWVYDNAMVCGKGAIYNNAMIYDKAWVSGNAIISKFAQIYGKAQIWGDFHISSRVIISGDTIVSCNMFITGNIRLESGIWNNGVTIHGKRYLTSTTLQKVLLE